MPCCNSNANRAAILIMGVAAASATFLAATSIGADDSDNSPAKETAGPDTASPTPTLQDRLDTLKQRFLEAAPEERARIYEQGIRDVAESEVMDSALRAGDEAPNFTLPNATGDDVTLDALLEDGPVVLVWYRGGWCPYCNIQLQAYQESLSRITDLDATLAAISPELPDFSLSTKQKNALEFQVLSDVSNTVAEKFGLVYRIPQDVIEQFRGRLDLPGANGDDSWTLPLAVTYVIDTDRTIAWAHVQADYRVRAEPADVIRALRERRAD